MDTTSQFTEKFHDLIIKFSFVKSNETFVIMNKVNFYTK